MSRRDAVRANLVIVASLLSVLYLPFSVEAQTLRGSPASVDRIHRQAVDQRLQFFASPTEVRSAVNGGRLVRLHGNADYELGSVSYPYLLPEAHTFVTRLASQYRAACGEKLVVTSATRPRSVRLANSVDKTVHPTGMAVDLRRPSNQRCLSWLRRTLIALEGRGVLEAVEERRPPHFHVAVFPRQYARYVQQQGGGRIQMASAPDPAATRAAAASAASAARSSHESDVRYRVRSGDSLWTIARRHGTSVEEIKRANELRSSRILAGQVLLIPRNAR
jgi:LysM repeat protein